MGKKKNLLPNKVENKDEESLLLNTQKDDESPASDILEQGVQPVSEELKLEEVTDCCNQEPQDDNSDASDALKAEQPVEENTTVEEQNDEPQVEENSGQTEDIDGANLQDASVEKEHEDGEQIADSIENQEKLDVVFDNSIGRKKRRKRRKISEITFENDIKYRGPFSYRWLRIFSWVAIACAQIAIIMSLGARVDAKIAKYDGLIACFQIIGTLSVPLFLIANFAVIINAKNGYHRLIVAYAFMAIVIFSLFMLVYQRYILGILAMFIDNESGLSPQQEFNKLFRELSPSGFIAFNIFIDLLMCTLLTYFINYTPSKVFVGKKLAIFRAFVIFPILYEITSFTLKVLGIVLPGFTLPLYIMPFLTTKPPLTFVVFVVLSVFVKNRELVFLRRGKTREQYAAFLKTNTNSLHFSISTSVAMVLAALIDLVLYLIIGFSLTVIGEDDSVLVDGMAMAQNMGFGKSVSLLLVVPFVMLFSYTRVHKASSSNVDVIIPLVGLLAFAICYAEGVYQFILRLPQILGGLMNG